MCRSLQDINSRKIHPEMEKPEFPTHICCQTHHASVARVTWRHPRIVHAQRQRSRCWSWATPAGKFRLVEFVGASATPSGQTQDVDEAPPLWRVSTRLQFDTCEVCLSWATVEPPGGYIHISLLVILYRLLNISHTNFKSQMAAPQNNFTIYSFIFALFRIWPQKKRMVTFTFSEEIFL